MFEIQVLLPIVWFFQSQPHRPAHVRHGVRVAHSSHSKIQLWGPCHSLYERTFPKSISDAVILCALVEYVFRSLSHPLEGSYVVAG